MFIIYKNDIVEGTNSYVKLLQMMQNYLKQIKVKKTVNCQKNFEQNISTDPEMGNGIQNQ